MNPDSNPSSNGGQLVLSIVEGVYRAASEAWLRSPGLGLNDPSGGELTFWGG